MHAATELLAHLIGSWDLQGQMGETPLRQDVECRWMLGGLFIEVHCTSVLAEPAGARPYEAVYHIGYNADHDRFAMHLLDTTGVALTCAVGVGQREGNAISFVFDYASGPFTNRFVWDERHDSWLMELTASHGEQRELFATKMMTRRRSAT
jgi:hypothetical protein